MAGKKQKINLKMDEDNSVSFALSIEGYSSDASLTSKPSVRFVMTEGRNGTGFVFPAKFEDGEVCVDIPSSTIYSENCEYDGKLEVFLGNRYFTPAELSIQFEKPLKVEATIKGTVLEGSATQEPVVATIRRSASKPLPSRPKPLTSTQKPQPKVVQEKLVREKKENLIDVQDELTSLLKEEEELKKKLLAMRAAKQKQAAIEKAKQDALPENKFKEKLKKILKESLD